MPQRNSISTDFNYHEASSYREASLVRDLLNDFSIAGDWCSGADINRSQVLQGTFDYRGTDGEMGLLTDGLYEDRVSWTANGGQVCKVDTAWELNSIHAQLNESQFISLLRVFLSQSHNGKTLYRPYVAIIGSKRKSEAELQYIAAEFCLSAVTSERLQWISNKQPLVLATTPEMTISCRAPRPDEIAGEFVVFRVEYETEQPIETITSAMFWISELFTVLHGTPTMALSQTVYAADGAVDEVLFGHRGNLTPRNVAERDMLVPLLVFSEEQFRSMVEKWCSLDERVKVAVYLLANTLRFESTLHQVNLVNRAQAIEALHRALYFGADKYIDVSKYETTVRDVLTEAIPKGLDAGLHSSLVKKLEHANQFSQRRRLKDIIRRLRKSVPKTFDMLDEDYQKRIIDTRNYFIHFDQGIERLTDKSIPFASFSLQCVLQGMLLAEIGVPPELISSAMRTSRAWQNFLFALGQKERLFTSTVEERNRKAKAD